MFGYNENKQASFHHGMSAPTARGGGGRLLKVCIIHPGKPRNPNQPGLEELIKRPEPFL